MPADDIARAKRLFAELRLPIRPAPTRRFLPAHAGTRIDMRRTLRDSLRHGGASIELSRRRRRTHPPTLVVLCDISGSMSRYSRMLLHFLHALTTERQRAYTFVFGNPLPNTTPSHTQRQVTAALPRFATPVTERL